MTTRVVDYAWTHPASLAAYAGVMRYISHDASKDLSAAERDWVRSQAKTIGLVFESTANRAAQGFAAGASDATYANQRADALGYPKNCTLWYAVDFDASAAQVQPYFDGIASVGGRPHAPYGGFKVVEGVRYPALGWQTVAWSAGRISSRAGLLQDRFSGSYDENRVLVDAYGAWGATGPTPPPTTEDDDMSATSTDELRYGPGEQCTIDLDNLVNGGAGWRHAVVRIPWDFVGGPRTHAVRVLAWSADGSLQKVVDGDELVLSAAKTAVIGVKPEWAALTITSKAPERDPRGDTTVRTVFWK